MSEPSLPAEGPGPASPPRELPPVEPPSAGFILQLFVIPALIVAVLIVVVALFGKLAEGSRDATSYVQAIRSNNANVRWRAAYELANLVRNEPNLAADPRLLGELTDALNEALVSPDPEETTLRYLAAALGAFRVTTAQNASGRSVDPLASLAEALAPRRPLPVRVAAAESLARLGSVRSGSSDHERAVAALAVAAEDADPDLRQRAVFALGFYPGAGAESALREALDDGDRFVRYNAANALARRGDDAAMPTLREMLSPRDLETAVRAENADETQHRVESIHLEALAALESAARSGHPTIARDLLPEVEALQKSPLAGVRVQAQSLGKILQSASETPLQ